MNSRAKSSLLPVFLILAVALVVFSPVLKNWEPFAKLIPSESKVSASDNPVKVWVNERSGFYYCPGSALFRKVQPGRSLPLSEALQKGYQPAEGQTCR